MAVFVRPYKFALEIIFYFVIHNSSSLQPSFLAPTLATHFRTILPTTIVSHQTRLPEERGEKAEKVEEKEAENERIRIETSARRRSAERRNSM